MTFFGLLQFLVFFNGLFAPTSWNRMSNIFRDSESLRKSSGKKWSIIWTFSFGSDLKSPRKKKFFFAEFALVNPLMASVLLSASVERCLVSLMRDFCWKLCSENLRRENYRDFCHGPCRRLKTTAMAPPWEIVSYNLTNRQEQTCLCWPIDRNKHACKTVLQFVSAIGIFRIWWAISQCCVSLCFFLWFYSLFVVDISFNFLS